MAMRYAQEYDPKSAQEGGCFSPDPQTASYWYEAVVNQIRKTPRRKPV
jgi:hypothetical protein